MLIRYEDCISGFREIIVVVLAAAALSRACGIEVAAVRTALASFELDAHRIQVVAERDGVTWVNDSKATNPHAADASLRAYPSVVWVVGGLLKGVDVDALVAAHVGRLRGAVVIGVDDLTWSPSRSRTAVRAGGVVP